MISNRVFIVLMPRLGVMLYLIFTAISIIFYTGGTVRNPDTLGYSFTQNFFSDLGKLSSDNFLAMIFFSGSLFVVGITFSIYFYYLMKSYNYDSLGIMAKIGSGLGILGALCFIGVGFTPHNVLFTPHIFFVNWAFRSFLLSSLLLSIVLFKDDRLSSRYGIGYLFFAISIFLYILVLEFAPKPELSEISLIFNVLAQKAIVLIFLLSVLYQSFGNSKLAANNSSQ